MTKKAFTEYCSKAGIELVQNACVLRVLRVKWSDISGHKFDHYIR